MPNFTTESRLRVRYAETDQMGVVYHANFLVWMEIGRTDHCRERGFAYTEMEAAGFRLAVTDVHCRYQASAKYDDEILVVTRVREARSRQVIFDYEIRHGVDGRLLATGDTTHTVINPEGRLTRMSEYFLKLLQGEPNAE